MYADGACPDYRWSFEAYAPSAPQLAAALAAESPEAEFRFPSIQNSLPPSATSSRTVKTEAGDTSDTFSGLGSSPEPSWKVAGSLEAARFATEAARFAAETARFAARAAPAGTAAADIAVKVADDLLEKYLQASASEYEDFEADESAPAGSAPEDSAPTGSEPASVEDDRPPSALDLFLSRSWEVEGRAVEGASRDVPAGGLVGDLVGGDLPLPRSIPKVLEEGRRGNPLLPVVCALAMLPVGAASHAPTPVRGLMTDKSTLGDVYFQCPGCQAHLKEIKAANEVWIY